MSDHLSNARCPQCKESVRLSTELTCAECLCEWCTHSFLFVIARDTIRFVDLSGPSWISEAESIASQMGFRFVDVERQAIGSDCYSLMSLAACRNMNLLVLETEPTLVLVASPTPDRLDVLESLRFSIGRPVRALLASRDAIQRVLSLREHEVEDATRDPQEDAPNTGALIRRAFREAKKLTDQYWRGTGDPDDRNYNAYARHLFARQRRCLSEEYGITWHPPFELNTDHRAR